MKRVAVPIEREYGPFPQYQRVNGVTFDGKRVWFATNEELVPLDPETGELGPPLQVRCDAGTAFDGTHLYQLAEGRIDKIEPHTGKVVSSVKAPNETGISGMTWAEGSLWVGRYGDRQILELDPQTGAILRTVQSDRFVTGVSFADGQLWHATSEGGESELRRVDPNSGEVLECLELPKGVRVSGLEADGQGSFYCGAQDSTKVRVVKRPKYAAR